MEPLQHEGQVLDQSLAALTRCYSNTDAPQKVIAGLGQGADLTAQITEFAANARQGIYMPELLTHILKRSATPAVEALPPQLLLEVFWIIFSQKTWARLRALAERLPAETLAALPYHIADMCFLSCYRQYAEALQTGQGQASMAADLDMVRAFLLRVWGPKAAHHHQAYAAMQAHIMGDWAQARAVFAKLKADDFLGAFGGIATVLPAEALSDQSRPKLEAFRVYPAPNGAQIAALISLDQGYFKKYGLLAAQIFAQTNPGQALHFHAIGFDPRPDIAGWSLPIQIGVTLDDTDLSPLSMGQRRGYYANARLLYAAEYLQIYRKIFVADADGGVMRNLDDLAKEAQGLDLLLTTQVLSPGRELTKLPWQAVLAGSVFFSDTPASHGFADRLARYLGYVTKRAFSHDQKLWFSDQAALFYCWSDLRHDLACAPFAQPAFKQDGGWKLFSGAKGRMSFMTKAQSGL